jgi:hypothetical protein
MENSKISLTHYGLEHTTEIENDAPVVDYIEAFCNLMVTAGWPVSVVNRGILERAMEIETDVKPFKDEEG